MENSSVKQSTSTRKGTQKSKDREKKLRDKSWVQGYFAAVASMDRGHDIGIAAEEAIEAMGVYTVSDLKDYGVSEYDIEILKKHLPYVRDRRDRNKKK
ncbi:hypothetical protein [Bdellovibrio sp. BCCA]|uniref:hypothetical protein n=1 Tax=Bdellovibrio sp. BCCA TaxID=3136281 RepID=UPI0030F013C6